MNNNGDVQVSLRPKDQVIQALCITIPIACNTYHREGRVRKPYSSRDRDCPPVKGVKTVEVHKIEELAVLADAGNKDVVFQGVTFFIKSSEHLIQRLLDNEIPAPRAPGILSAADEIPPFHGITF
jgi:hypothetical protein